MMDDSESSDEGNFDYYGQPVHEPRQPRREVFKRNVQESKDYKMKTDLPTFGGRMDIEQFLEWAKNVENFFDFANTPEDKKMSLQTHSRCVGLVGNNYKTTDAIMANLL